MMNKVQMMCMLGLIAFASSCSTDFDPLASGPAVPVVYSVINYPDTVRWVRVSRSFQLRGSAYGEPVSGDSLEFKDIRVSLEKWHGDYLIARSEMLPEERLRDSGYFPAGPNPFFQLRYSTKTLDFFSGNSEDLIKLIIERPGQPIVYSQIHPVTIPEISTPRHEGEKVELFNLIEPFFLSWTSMEYYQEMYLEFHYADHYADRSIDRIALWKEYHSIPPPDPEKPLTKVFLTGVHFMQRVASNIRLDTAVTHRTFKKIVMRLYLTDENIYTYNIINQVIQEDQAGAGNTNIVNGCGLFGATSRAERWFILAYRSMDSLANGQYTKHLNFTNWGS
ncbi:MAG: hypothetical protein A2X22_01965 [Bacteroidetes bacterium GWF2_49_14]|nr:MAG: hypothetical protein A2X22_01965 [Bacteroidetes bacterium GWF2_49_14]